MISYVDTDKVEGIARELSSAANDLEVEFNDLFKRFDNVPTGTREWTGTQAKFYFSRVAQDKQQYLNLVSELRNISRELNDEASSARACIQENNTK